MAKALLITFLAAQAVGFLPLYSVVCFHSTFYGRHMRPWWFEWSLWALAVACAAYLVPEAVRSWKRLEGDSFAPYLTGLIGFFWGFALSFGLSTVWD